MPAHDIHTRAIARTAAVIVVAIVACVAGVFALLHLWGTPGGADRAQAPHLAQAGGPALQAAPQVDLARYRAQKQHQLTTAGWVDRERGIVHIPIDAAMDLLATQSAASASSPQEQR